MNEVSRPLNYFGADSNASAMPPLCYQLEEEIRARSASLARRLAHHALIIDIFSPLTVV